MSNIVYFYIKNNKPIYVGKTQNIWERYIHHKRDEYGKNFDFLLLIEFKNPVLMDIAEIYYINLFKPIYNKKNLYNHNFTLEEEKFLLNLENFIISIKKFLPVEIELSNRSFNLKKYVYSLLEEEINYFSEDIDFSFINKNKLALKVIQNMNILKYKKWMEV